VALEMVATRDYDVVLMDVQMPRLDGYAATREIRAREQEQRVPVLAMTAAAIEGERERCLAAGMDDFLTKPVDPEALAAALARVLEGLPPPPKPVPPRAHALGRELDLSRLDMLRDMAPGNTTYLDRAIGHFVANAPQALASIRAAIDAQDAGALQQAAHRLAGSASNIGVVPVGEAARNLELVADGGTTDGAADLLGPLDEAVSRGTAALLAYRASYGGAEAV
jgi:response regulator RpfG family c-di-GMP phosphodiesterase